MNLKNLQHALVCAVLVSLATGCGNASKPEPEPAQRNASDVVSGMRLKQLTKEFSLTDEQQSQMKVLVDEEGKEIAKVRDMADLSLTQQSAKIGEIKRETYNKMKPILNPTQLEKLEKLVSKAAKK